MYPPKKSADQILNEVLTNPVNTKNPYQATAIVNTDFNQQYSGVPINDESLRSGVLLDSGHTAQEYSSVLGKDLMRAAINAGSMFTSTLLSIPNFIDNQINEGNDRVLKPISDISDSLLKDYQPIKKFGNDQSIAEWLTPSWISGNPESAWGDLIEQTGILGGIALGTIATGGVLGASGKAVAGLDAFTGLNAGAKIKNAVSTLLNPRVIEGAETFAVGLVNSQKVQSSIAAKNLYSGLSRAAQFAGINAVQTYTEAIFEGLEGERNFIENEVKNYTDLHGEAPSGITLDEIKANAKELKDDRFLLNTIGLSISNIPFAKAFLPGKVGTFVTDKLDDFGKTVNAKGDIINKPLKWLKEDSLLQTPARYLNKGLVAGEGFEELYQLGVDKGLDNYYTNKINTKNFEGSTQDILESLKVGASSTFSKEGLKSFILGAGIGSIAQGVTSFKEYKDLTKYLNTEQTVRLEDGTEEKITPKQQIKKDVENIDKVLEDISPLSKNSSALNNTFGERLQQFATNANNAEELVKVQGTSLENDVAQRVKFDNIFPYIKKGYKDVIVNKIEGLYQDESKNLSIEKYDELQKLKASALEDINVIETFTKKVDGAFSENYTDPNQQIVHNALKDIAVYHSWNLHQVNKKQAELDTLYGSTLFEDKTLSLYNGKNLDKVIDSEIKRTAPLEGFQETEEHKEFKSLSLLSNEEKKNKYWDIKTKNRPGELLTLESYVSAKKNRDKILERINTNNEVLQQLDTVRTNPVESAVYLSRYYNKGEVLEAQNSKKQKEKEIKESNVKAVEKLNLPEDLKKEVIKEVLPVEEILTPANILSKSEILKKEKEAQLELEKKEELKKAKQLKLEELAKLKEASEALKLQKEKKELEDEKEIETESLITSKVFSNFNMIENSNTLRNEIPLVTEITKDSVQITKVEALANEADGRLNGLAYDIGLIRDSTHIEARYVFQGSIKNIEGDNVPSFIFNNNQVNFKIDLTLLDQYLNDHKEQLTHYDAFKTIVKNSSENQMPFIDFLNLISSPDKYLGKEVAEEMFQELQKFPMITDFTQVGDRKVTIGKNKLYLFRFIGSTLDQTLQQLTKENELFKQLSEENLDELDVVEFIKENLIIEFTPTKKEFVEFEQPILAAGAHQNSVFEVVKNNEVNELRFDDLTFLKGANVDKKEYIKKLTAFVNGPNSKNYFGHYIGFPTKNNSIFIRPIRSNVSWEDFQESIKPDGEFKVGFLWTNSKTKLESDAFYNVKINNGEFTVFENGKILTVKKDKASFEKWVESIRSRKAETNEVTVNYYEEGVSAFNAIWKTGRTNYKLIADTRVEVKGILKTLALETKKPKKKVKEVPLIKEDLNSFTEEDSKKDEVRNFEIVIDADNILKPVMQLGAKTYVLKDDATVSELEDNVKVLKDFGNLPDEILETIIKSRYTVQDISFSTISEFQLNKIQEFIKNC